MPQQLPRPDARTIRRSQALESAETSQVLWAAGDLLRESDVEAHLEARGALARITPAAARDALSAIDPAHCSGELARALDVAFDAALEDDADARADLESDAMEGLEQRDVVDCLLCAVSTFDGRADVDSEEAASLREAASVLSGTLLAADAKARARVRELTALNEGRRVRAEALDDAARDRAWWWSELSGEEHDGLVELLAGRDVQAGDAATREAARAALPDGRDALGAALRSLDGGGLARGDAERWVELAAKRNAGDAIALDLVRTLDVSAIDDDAVA